MELSKITKQSCSREFMKTYLQKALEQKTITKKSFAEWKKEVKAIESGEGTAKDKLQKVKDEFYKRFIKPEKEKAKIKKGSIKKKTSTHPLYDMFNGIEVPKEQKTENKSETE